MCPASRHHMAKRTAVLANLSRLSFSTVICVLQVSIRAGQLEDLNLVPVLKNSKFLRTDHLLVGHYRARG